jgi:hypothetical protein
LAEAEDMTEHLQAYRWFVRGVVLSAAHSLVILALLGLILL